MSSGAQAKGLGESSMSNATPNVLAALAGLAREGTAWLSELSDWGRNELGRLDDESLARRNGLRQALYETAAEHVKSNDWDGFQLFLGQLTEEQLRTLERVALERQPELSAQGGPQAPLRIHLAAKDELKRRPWWK